MGSANFDRELPSGLGLGFFIAHDTRPYHGNINRDIVLTTLGKFASVASYPDHPGTPYYELSPNESREFLIIAERRVNNVSQASEVSR